MVWLLVNVEKYSPFASQVALLFPLLMSSLDWRVLVYVVTSEMSAAIEAAPSLLIETACSSFNQHWQEGARLACSTAVNSGINFFALQV